MLRLHRTTTSRDAKREKPPVSYSHLHDPLFAVTGQQILQPGEPSGGLTKGFVFPRRLTEETLIPHPAIVGSVLT